MSVSELFKSPAPPLKGLSFGSVPFLLSFDLKEAYFNKDLPELKNGFSRANKLLDDDPILDRIIEVFKIDESLVDNYIGDIGSTLLEVGEAFENYLKSSEEKLFSKIECDFGRKEIVIKDIIEKGSDWDVKSFSGLFSKKDLLKYFQRSMMGARLLFERKLILTIVSQIITNNVWIKSFLTQRLDVMAGEEIEDVFLKSKTVLTITKESTSVYVADFQILFYYQIKKEDGDRVNLDNTFKYPFFRYTGFVKIVFEKHGSIITSIDFNNRLEKVIPDCFKQYQINKGVDRALKSSGLL
jgi:hypothetical protein